MGQRAHVVSTPTSPAAPGSGGAASLFSFRFGIPCWACNLGECAYADNTWQDDLAFISRYFTGFGYRWEDGGRGIFGATNRRLTGTDIAGGGVIGLRQDEWYDDSRPADLNR